MSLDVLSMIHFSKPCSLEYSSLDYSSGLVLYVSARLRSRAHCALHDMAQPEQLTLVGLA